MFGPVVAPDTEYSQYQHHYSDNQALEAFVLGVVSLALTLLNIICIIITGIVILRVKEVTPDKIPQTFSEFWKTDVKSRRGKYSRLEVRLPKEPGEGPNNLLGHFFGRLSHSLDP